ncbi:hypothetical protein HYS47_04935 [Candidatus Woesearchaeota archaeon]|nr:hypothetical protein [Candidatus Woesearchaeota archaeon]
MTGYKREGGIMGLFTKEKKPVLKGLPPPPLPSIEGRISSDLSFPDLPNLDLPPLPSQKKTAMPVPPPPRPQEARTSQFSLPDIPVPRPKQAPREQQLRMMKPLDLELPALLSLEKEEKAFEPMTSDLLKERKEKAVCSPIPLPKIKKEQKLSDEGLTFPDLRFPEIPPMFRKPTLQKGEATPQELPDLDLPELQPLQELGEKRQPRMAREQNLLVQKGCLYVEMQMYTDLLNNIHETQDSVKHAGTAVEQLNSLKNKEDSSIEALKASIEGMQRKFQYLDKMLFETNSA